VELEVWEVLEGEGDMGAEPVKPSLQNSALAYDLARCAYVYAIRSDRCLHTRMLLLQVVEMLQVEAIVLGTMERLARACRAEAE
jgi:hypothetical protein